MPKLFITSAIVLAAILSGCQAPAGSTEPKQKPLAVQNANQHMAIGVTLAMFYCAESRWPADVVELKQYSDERNLPLPTKPDWEWLTRPEVDFTFSENVTLHTPKGAEEGDVAVTSINEAPGCEGGKVKVNIDVKFGS